MAAKPPMPAKLELGSKPLSCRVVPVAVPPAEIIVLPHLGSDRADDRSAAGHFEMAAANHDITAGGLSGVDVNGRGYDCQLFPLLLNSCRVSMPVCFHRNCIVFQLSLAMSDHL